MPVTTASAAFHITPVVIKTFLNHAKRKTKKLNNDKNEDDDALDDILFDEAFHIVKAFIQLGTKNTIESLQAFTNTHVPAPYWAAVSPVTIPLSSCNRAADLLIEWFGPEELKHVVGGERWWQVRGLDGVEGEWITQKKFLDASVAPGRENLSSEDQNIIRMESLDTVMLYIHGGGYFWGSINTHRYQIIRYARKFRGRAFAVNYRKAPQYPWPCPLQDVLAAYMYLIQPPTGALHMPIPASRIVLAGDSAGGGLCVAVLTVMRDLGLPMPSGAVLISPWVDLTHSFPSVMENVKTDIIPEHGFLAKPSTLWPTDPIPPEGGRVVPTTTNSPPQPGHSDTLKPSPTRIGQEMNGDDMPAPGEKIMTQEEMLDRGTPTREDSDNTTLDSYDIDTWEPKPPKVLMENPNAVPLELRSQIQQYAKTEQLSHPLVSPVLQGSLANLPALYILAGDGEVLRDEIIYLAHRAAHPNQYPVRAGVLRDGRRQKANVEKFTKPTKVHLQVFDGMCHVLPVFSFTDSAKYAYRAIAEFVKHVSHHDEEHLERNPFPEFHRPPSRISTDSESDSTSQEFSRYNDTSSTEKVINKGTQHAKRESEKSSHTDIRFYRQNEQATAEQVNTNSVDVMPESLHSASSSSNPGNQQKDIPGVAMIRERVDLSGKARPMEPAEELQALKLKPGEVGIIKEAPALRWLKGQEEWDKRYKRRARRVIKQRRKLEEKAARMLKNAVEQGFVHESHGRLSSLSQEVLEESSNPKIQRGEIQSDRRWGPLDLEDESPPPSAIANRRDTPEALALLKKSIYHTAPITHRAIPKMTPIDAIRAAFDPNDDPVRPPQQSVSEQQVRAHIIPIHGLRVWDGIVRYFGRKSSEKMSGGSKAAAAVINSTTEAAGIRLDSSALNL